MTQQSTLIRGAAALVLTGALALTGCATVASPSGSAAPAAGGATVPVDVGNGTVDLPEGPLRLGIFFNAQSNAWQTTVATTAKEHAESLGWTATILDANFDVSTQLNQLQSAATNKSYDAVIVVPVDESECDALSRILPEAGTLVTVLSAPVCDRALASGDDLWVPGTLNYVGGDTDVKYYEAWFEAAAELNPGPQKAALVMGPELSPFSTVHKAALAEFEKTNSDFVVSDFLYTDYTTPTGFTDTQNYLRANPDVTVLLSVYTPDLTRGVVQAVEAAGLTGAVKIVDIGGSEYTAEQIEAGTVEATLGFFPIEAGTYAVDAIAAAQAGDEPERFVSVIPEQFGTVEDPLIVTAENLDEFTPEY